VLCLIYTHICPQTCSSRASVYIRQSTSAHGITITYMCMSVGFILQMLYSCFMGFWCFHTIHLFLGLSFPFKMEILMKSSSKRKKIHITEVVIVLLYGLSSPIIAVSVTKHQNNGSICVPQSNSVTFYGEILPNIAVLCIGVVILFMSLWILRKVSL